MANNYYGNYENVIHSLRTSPEEFDFTKEENGEQVPDNEAFKTFVESKMTEVKSLINEYCDRDFSTEETIPNAINLASEQMTINYLMSNVASRQAQTTAYTEYPTFITVKLLTDDIKAQLDIFKRKSLQPFLIKCFIPVQKRRGEPNDNLSN